MKITIAQLDPVIGDIPGNLKKVREVAAGHGNSSDLIVFSELFLTGYPPRDLLENSGFIDSVDKAVREIKEISSEYASGILIGLPSRNLSSGGNKLFNSAFLFSDGKIAGEWHKTLLPVYDVFDETRYFEPGSFNMPVLFKGEMIGVSICEDMWCDHEMWPHKIYGVDPVNNLAESGATIMINLSASPFFAGKDSIRYDIIKSHAVKYKVPFFFINQVGGNDELVFDGGSICLNGDGMEMAILPSFRECVRTVDTEDDLSGEIYVPREEIPSVHDALVLGLSDYMKKTGFNKAVLGLSGGIDSAVTCVIAARAAGAENVTGISMPSQYSAGVSEEYSRRLAQNLGIDFKVIPISDIYFSYLETLDKYSLEKEDVGIALQNIQARIRGNILMFFSNEYGDLLLTTGNKSELATGYCTLYGDMAGGLAVINDVPKMMVYRLAEHINSDSEIIPHEIIERVPSAELKPDQADQDTLPPYEVLDKILSLYLEDGASSAEIKERGFDPGTVDWVISAVNRNEYKRRQAPPGLKVTNKAFGTGRRMPIAARFKI